MLQGYQNNKLSLVESITNVNDFTLDGSASINEDTIYSNNNSPRPMGNFTAQEIESQVNG
jgi:hypothetical protein